MDGSAATQAQAATAIQANPPRPVPNVPGPPLAPRPAIVVAANPSTLLKTDLTVACPKQAQWAIAVLLAVTVLLVAVHAIASLPFAARPSHQESGELLNYRLDLNQASRAELMQLPGVGPNLADRILAYRQSHGKFHAVADLAKVSGIGPTMLKRIEGWVCVNESPRPAKVSTSSQASVKSGSPGGTVPTPTKASSDPPWEGPPLDLNTATPEQLQKLPRIGPVLSQRIIAERTIRPFSSVDDLKRVKGIGVKTLAGLKPFVTVGK